MENKVEFCMYFGKMTELVIENCRKKSGLAMSSLLINNPKDEFVREFISLEQNKNAENEIAKKIIEKLKENGEYEKMILEIKKI